jgi:hypothetical protein
MSTIKLLEISKKLEILKEAIIKNNPLYPDYRGIYDKIFFIYKNDFSTSQTTPKPSAEPEYIPGPVKIPKFRKT